MKKLGLVGFIFVVFFTFFSYQSDPLLFICKAADCRENKYVTMRTPDGVFAKTIELYWPIVYHNRISLLPGDIVFIEAEATAIGLGNFRLVEQVVNPEKTIELSFTQINNKIDTVLVVKNPFPKNIKYHLQTMDFKGNIAQVMSCPVTANSKVTEQWEYVVLELILSDMHFLAPNDAMSCVY